MSTQNPLIEEILNRTNIVQIIQDYVPLKKQGRRFIGLCPFHQENTPSFSVSEEKNLFYCFGCHEGGNVFQFLMKYKNLSFFESLVELGKQVGIDVKKSSVNEENDDHHYFLLKIYKESASLYHKNLTHTKSGDQALKYLESRSISQESINQFFLGYAYNDWINLFKYLSGKGYLVDQLLKSSLVAQGKNNSYYDYFRHRVIFPILDENHRIIAFGGRVLDDSKPKYINTPENYFFRKREILYGLNFAKEEIKSAGKVIIVEGYLDVIMAHQMGIKNVVAPLGTGLTEKHIQKLKRFSDKIVLVFDGDSAGEKAMLRGLTIALKGDINTKVVSMPTNLDPFDFISKYGKNSFLELIEKAQPALQFRIHNAYNLLPEKISYYKRQYLNDIYQFIDQLNNEILKEEAFSITSEVLSIPEASIKKEYHNRHAKNPSPRPLEEQSTKLDTEEFLLFSLINHPDLFPNYINKIPIEQFKNPANIQLFNKMKDTYNTNGKLDYNILLKEIKDESKRKHIMDHLFNEKYQFEPVQMIQDCLNKIKLNHIQSQKASISKMIIQAQKNQTIDINDLLEEKQFLINEENKLKQKDTATWKD